MADAKRIRVIWSSPTSDTWVSTFWFQAADTASSCASAVVTFANAIKGKIGNAVTGALDPSCYTIDLATMKPTGITAVSGTISGVGASGDVLPYSTQGLMRLRTGVFVNGREMRGRLFLPAPAEVDNDSGFPLSSYQTSMAAAGNALVADAGTNWSILSRRYAALTTISSVSVKNNWAVLRSRRDV
jgi:hypothetical protein